MQAQPLVGSVFLVELLETVTASWSEEKHIAGQQLYSFCFKKLYKEEGKGISMKMITLVILG